MKIRLNYDLIDKVKESKKGLLLKRVVNKSFCYSGLNTLFWMPFNQHIYNNLSQATVKDFIYFSLGYFSILSYLELKNKTLVKNESLDKLKRLASMLRDNYVNTDYELLQDSYEYDRSYSVILDDNKFLRLKQDKYIMIPTTDGFGDKEISLVQEHLIGSKDYELSYGSPKKVLKPTVSFGY